MSEPHYFVWIKGRNGRPPAPEHWHGDMMRGVGTFQHKAVGDPDGDLLFFEELPSEHRALSLDQLIKLYPWPPKKPPKSGTEAVPALPPAPNTAKPAKRVSGHPRARAVGNPLQYRANRSMSV